MLEATTVIVALLVVLCSLAALDLWRQMAIKHEDSAYTNYAKAVKFSGDFWKLGFRLEDLEVKAAFQHTYWLSIKHQINTALAPKFKLDKNTLRQNTHNIAYTRQSRITLHNLLRNDSSVYQINCGSSGPLVRLGVNDFRTDSRDVCQLFTGTPGETLGPHAMFEMVPYQNGAFALRSVSSSRFVRAVPPPPDNSLAPWKLVVGGTLVGSAESFRMTPDGKLYSGLMDGFFTCGGFGQMLSGSPGQYSQYNSEVFVLQAVGPEAVRSSYQLLDLSNELMKVQTAYSRRNQKTDRDIKSKAQEITGLENTTPVRICIGIPMTSRGTIMSDVVDSPFWTNIFDSFMKSVDWRSNRFVFRFYLGFDKADELYDTGDAWSDIREEFRHRATYRMVEQLMDEAAINAVLNDQLSLKLMHFDHLQDAPSQVVSQLMLSAYMDNFDYFYQVNDDTIIKTPNWAPQLVNTLASNPSIPNFGVTGPSDTNNGKIFTHSFVHRTHFEVFGHLFPPYFKNWWSDDWITTVYGAEHTFRNDDVQIEHNTNAQKSNGIMRYTVDQSAQVELDTELRKGYVQVDQWLKKNKLPRLSLPIVCGYIPLVKYLAPGLKSSSSKSAVTTDTAVPGAAHRS
ncbi:hypothetical protein B484DRAFT_361726 [Ochromonadaceae sp. CCMP2298]|nr:hypothetical protein B484DRAFT_361726 [Ochromonadaceae sp. CCMP2298]